MTSHGTTSVGYWLNQHVVMSQVVASLRMYRVFRYLQWLSSVGRSKHNFSHKQRHYYLLKGLNGLDRNVVATRDRLRVHRHACRLMNVYRRKRAFRRVFWLPYMQHGLKALSHGTLARLRGVVKFWYTYVEFLMYSKSSATQRAEVHFSRAGKKLGFRRWLHKHWARMQRTRANQARLDLWNVTLQSYYFRLMYRIIAIRRRFRMITWRFKAGHWMDIWARATERKLRYKFCIVENRQRILFRLCLKVVAAWRLYTKQQAYYCTQALIITRKAECRIRKSYMVLWLHRMWQKEEAMMCQAVYDKTCCRVKVKALHAWIHALKASRKDKRNKRRAIFNVLCEYAKERKHKR